MGRWTFFLDQFQYGEGNTRGHSVQLYNLSPSVNLQERRVTVPRFSPSLPPSILLSLSLSLPPPFYHPIYLLFLDFFYLFLSLSILLFRHSHGLTMETRPAVRGEYMSRFQWSNVNVYCENSQTWEPSKNSLIHVTNLGSSNRSF